MLGVYLFMLPLAAIIFFLGMMIYRNEFGVEHYGIDCIEKQNKQRSVSEQKKRNKIGGSILMILAIVVVILPILVC